MSFDWCNLVKNWNRIELNKQKKKYKITLINLPHYCPNAQYRQLDSTHKILAPPMMVVV